MSPDVNGLIGQLKEAQDAVSGWAVVVTVAGDNAVLMENLKKKKNAKKSLWKHACKENLSCRLDQLKTCFSSHS